MTFGPTAGVSSGVTPRLCDPDLICWLLPPSTKRDPESADYNRWETIKKWALLERDLTVEGGELTPSLKVKRAVVAERNKELLDSFYL